MWEHNRVKAYPLGIFLSDIHLCPTAPPARDHQNDWYYAMSSAFSEVRMLQIHLNNPPIIVPGDIFDNGYRGEKCPPQLINFAIQEFERFPGNVWTIPGQHDLPNHRYDMRENSAYWTLVKNKVIHDMPPYTGENAPVMFSVWAGEKFHAMFLYPYPWKFEILPFTGEVRGWHICVAHKYIWTGDSASSEGTGYVGAERSDLVGSMSEVLQRYDAAFFGDNHKGFPTPIRVGNCEVLNCGAFIRRKADEREYRPAVGVFYSNGRILKQYLDTSYDRWDEAYIQSSQEQRAKEPRDFSEYIQELRELATGDSLKFNDLVFSLLEKMTWELKATREDVRRVLEEVTKKDFGGAL